jgi:hypothetical protein
MVLEVSVWIGISYLVMSVAEWVAHKYIMHSRRFAATCTPAFPTFERHAVLHHGRYFKEFDAEPDTAAKHISIALSPLENLLFAAPALILLCYFGQIVGAITFASFICTHAIAWNVLHAEFHYPKGRWYSRNRLYTYLRNYHKMHHDRPGTNFNIVCIGADFVFGTHSGCSDSI